MGASLFMQISDMKRFVFKAFLFVFLVALCDCLFGLVFPVTQEYAKGGSTWVNTYISKHCDADILVLGSSRAQHHYVPKILDSLGGVSFNAGNDGMGIILGLGRYMMCAEKHVPKIVIYELTPSFDWVKDDNSRYLNFLRPYGNKAYIRDIIAKIDDPFIRIKMLSSMYRNTSRIIPCIRDIFAKDESQYRGYRPNWRTYSGKVNGSKKKENPLQVLDTVKLEFLKQLVQETKSRGTKLYFAISPRFSKEKMNALPEIYAYAEEISRMYNTPLLNNMYIPGISDNPTMFDDATHLNNRGAKEYTRKVVNDLIVVTGMGK